MSLTLDAPDHRALTAAVEKYQQNPWRMDTLPEAEHALCCLPGRILAEICRGWLEQEQVVEESQDSAP